MSQEMEQGIANIQSAGTASRVELGEQVNKAASHLKLGDVRGMYIAGESTKVATDGIINKNPTVNLTSPNAASTLKADLGINDAASQIGSEVRKHALDRGLSPETAAWMETYAKNMARGLGGENSTVQTPKQAEKNRLDPKAELNPDAQSQRDPNSVRIENPLMRARGQSLADASQNLNPLAQPQAIAMTTDGQLFAAPHRTDQRLNEADMIKLGMAAGLAVAAIMTPTPEQIAAEKKRAELEQQRIRDEQAKATRDSQHRQALDLKEKLSTKEAQMIELQGREKAEQDILAHEAAAQTERIKAADAANNGKLPAGLESAVVKDKVDQFILGQTEYGQKNCLGMSLAADMDSLRAQLASKTR